MSSLTDDHQANDVFTFPGITSDQSPVEEITNTETTTDTEVIPETLINNFSEGSHHTAAALPQTGTPLPPRDALIDSINAVQSYLETAGCAVLADLQLQGLSAPVVYRDQNTIYGYIDEEIFRNLITDVLITHNLVTPPLAATEAELIDAVVTVHHLAFTRDMQWFEVDALTAADWPTRRGQQTTSPSGLVFTTPHPLQALQNHETLPERGLGLAAGIQHLAIDTPRTYTQTDVALPYLSAYLTGHGVTTQHANALLSSWYDTPGECVRNVEDDITQYFEETGLPATNPEYKYYLTREAVTRLTTGLK